MQKHNFTERKCLWQVCVWCMSQVRTVRREEALHNSAKLDALQQLREKSAIFKFQEVFFVFICHFDTCMKCQDVAVLKYGLSTDCTQGYTE